jgi:hypothetical protein
MARFHNKLCDFLATPQDNVESHFNSEPSRRGVIPARNWELPTGIRPLTVGSPLRGK